MNIFPAAKNERLAPDVANEKTIATTVSIGESDHSNCSGHGQQGCCGNHRSVRGCCGH